MMSQSCRVRRAINGKKQLEHKCKSAHLMSDLIENRDHVAHVGRREYWVE